MYNTDQAAATAIKQEIHFSRNEIRHLMRGVEPHETEDAQLLKDELEILTDSVQQELDSMAAELGECHRDVKACWPSALGDGELAPFLAGHDCDGAASRLDADLIEGLIQRHAMADSEVKYCVRVAFEALGASFQQKFTAWRQEYSCSKREQAEGSRAAAAVQGTAAAADVASSSDGSAARTSATIGSAIGAAGAAGGQKGVIAHRADPSRQQRRPPRISSAMLPPPHFPVPSTFAYSNIDDDSTVNLDTTAGRPGTASKDSKRPDRCSAFDGLEQAQTSASLTGGGFRQAAAACNDDNQPSSSQASTANPTPSASFSFAHLAIGSAGEGLSLSSSIEPGSASLMNTVESSSSGEVAHVLPRDSAVFQQPRASRYAKSANSTGTNHKPAEGDVTPYIFLACCFRAAAFSARVPYCIAFHHLTSSCHKQVTGLFESEHSTSND